MLAVRLWAVDHQHELTAARERFDAAPATRSGDFGD
jgi:hypothetical protein